MKMHRVVFAGVVTAGVGGAVLTGQTNPTATVTLPPLVLSAARVANDAPVGTFPMPVSGLRYEPLVDVQARDFAEGQADVAVRGGTFENTGFRIGGSALFDPQTGHYLAEIPVAPAMLSPVRVLTGVDNTLAGFNASVAVLAYDWQPVQPRGEMDAEWGPHQSRRGSLYLGGLLPGAAAAGQLAADVAVDHSQSDGPIPNGDHNFDRVCGRLEWRRGDAQIDFFGGYQAKFFGWPNLYATLNLPETENLQTTLAMLNARFGSLAGDHWQVSALWRRNRDDYELDRTRPGLFNPYQHETRVSALSLEGRRSVGAGWTLHGRWEAMADALDSTALTFGRFHTRTYVQTGAVVEKEERMDGGVLELRGGATWADDNRGPGRLSPTAEVAWRKPGAGANLRLYAQVAGASQVPGYTALDSNPNAGVFRGNPDLGRERTTNWEIGAQTGAEGTSAQAAVFVRQDRGLTDWTYRTGVAARSAQPIDTDTVGAEWVVTRHWSHGWVTLGYTWLQKSEDYGSAVVDASFYALNFPRHRATAAVVWRPVASVELRCDNEYREQEPNALRRGGRRAILSSIGVYWFVPAVKKLEVSVLVDNLWNSPFEAVPAVPAAPRRYAAGMSYRW